MGCRDCDSVTEIRNVYWPYRWGAATVLIYACPRHAQEIITALNAAQEALVLERSRREP